MKTTTLPPSLYPILKVGLPLFALIVALLTLVRTGDHEVPTIKASSIGTVPSISDEDGTTNSNEGADNSEGQDATNQRHMRWRFAEQNIIPREFRYKQDKMALVSNFCDSFASDAPKLAGALNANKTDTIVAWVEKHLLVIDNNLKWEAGPSKLKDTYDFTITCEQNRQLQPIVDTLVKRLKKKKIPNWEFWPCRNPMPLRNFDMAFQARRSKKSPRFNVETTIDDSDRSIQVKVTSKDFQGTNSRKDLGDSAAILELTLGENNLNHWIGKASTEEKNNRSNASGTPESDAAAFLRSFEKQKSAILSKLPTKHYWELKPPEQQTLVRFTPKTKSASERITLISWIPGFEHAAASTLFSSERFSKTGEKFCYLKAQGVGELVLPEKREAVEKQIDNEMRAAKLGCVIGAGSGTMESVYVDLCVSDVDKAIPKLRELCARLKLPKNTIMRFYDPEWRYEWVGMFDETSAPQNPDKLW